jgi:hypothetical protein
MWQMFDCLSRTPDRQGSQSRSAIIISEVHHQHRTSYLQGVQHARHCQERRVANVTSLQHSEYACIQP